MDIELKKYRASNNYSFSGRTSGLFARKAINMTKLDKTDNITVNLIIPADTTSFNPSFFLGLVYDSIRKLGMEEFFKKYKWIIESKNEDIKRAILKNIEDGYKSASYSLSLYPPKKQTSNWYMRLLGILK